MVVGHIGGFFRHNVMNFLLHDFGLEGEHINNSHKKMFSDPKNNKLKRFILVVSNTKQSQITGIDNA